MIGSTVPRRMLGRELRRLRETSGVSVSKACAVIQCSPQTMWRLEGGQGGVKLKTLYIEALCKLYEASDEDTAALLGLIEEAQRPGWWHSYGDCVPEHFDLYLGLEQSARRFTAWQTTFVPGLIQTPAYRRALEWTAFPGMPTSAVEQRVELIMKRQERLEDPAFSAAVLLSESVLGHEIGGPAVMADQIHQLIKVRQRRNVSIGVVPQTVGAHLGLQTYHFVLLEFPPRSSPELKTKWIEPPVVYVEGFTGALYLDQADKVDRYRSALVEIKRRALDEQCTRDLLAHKAKEYAV
ncbi:helix-turn-helix domain-containing protein [Nocardia sp. NPDC059091]|uniref:helix-turn-helix domain-containing protein n=1 Tax=unclassified Nocardia TaxID=2637762 RepID=UPI0036C8858A